MRTKTTYIGDDNFKYSCKPMEDTIRIKKTEDGYRAEYLCYDNCPMSPREYDNLGTMVCWHRRYDLGDKHDFEGHEDFIKALAREDGDCFCHFATEAKMKDYEDTYKYIGTLDSEEISDIVCKYNLILPLYLYDHSGITVSTRSFSCPWDSGQIGYVYVSHKNIVKEYGKLDIDAARKRLEVEVKEYDSYIQGDVYCKVTETYNKDKEPISYDVVGGYIGYKYAIEELGDAA